MRGTKGLLWSEKFVCRTANLPHGKRDVSYAGSSVETRRRLFSCLGFFRTAILGKEKWVKNAVFGKSSG